MSHTQHALSLSLSLYLTLSLSFSTTISLSHFFSFCHVCRIYITPSSSSNCLDTCISCCNTMVWQINYKHDKQSNQTIAHIDQCSPPHIKSWKADNLLAFDLEQITPRNSFAFNDKLCQGAHRDGAKATNNPSINMHLSIAIINTQWKSELTYW